MSKFNSNPRSLDNNLSGIFYWNHFKTLMLKFGIFLPANYSIVEKIWHLSWDNCQKWFQVQKVKQKKYLHYFLKIGFISRIFATGTFNLNYRIGHPFANKIDASYCTSQIRFCRLNCRNKIWLCSEICHRQFYLWFQRFPHICWNNCKKKGADQAQRWNKSTAILL